MLDKLPHKSILLRKTRAATEKHITPFLGKITQHALWKKLAKIGIFESLTLKAMQDPEHTADILMGLGEGCCDSGLILSIAAHAFAVSASIENFGSFSQKEKWLSKLISGDLIGSFAATEINAGSDIMSMETTYRKHGNYFILNGTKSYITNFEAADVFIVFATKDKRLYSRGIATFIVDSNAAGLKKAKANKKMGLNNSSLGSIELTNVEVSEENLLGFPGKGADIFQFSLMVERVLIMAGKVGVLRAHFENCCLFTKNRKQFSTAICENQFILEKLVNIYRNYITSRLLVLDAIRKLSLNQLSSAEASLTKLHVSEATLESHNDLLRIYGGLGYLENSGISTELCNAYGGIIYSGTSEIQKLIIASDLGLLG